MRLNGSTDLRKDQRQNLGIIQVHVIFQGNCLSCNIKFRTAQLNEKRSPVRYCVIKTVVDDCEAWLLLITND